MTEEEYVEEAQDPTEDEIAERLANYVGTSATADEKQNVHSFLHNVAIAEDTTKTGNLTAEELGVPILPVRTYKELALFCEEIANMDYFSNYFKKKAEIISSTSLSKDAKLLTLAVVQKREISEITPEPRKENKGWFKSKGGQTDKYGVPRV